MNQSTNQQFLIEKTFDLVKLIKSHITSIDIDDEETFYQLKQQLDILSCAIPESILDKIDPFVDERLQPLALTPTALFGEEPTLEDFLNYVISIEDEFQEIIDSTIRPFILGREYYTYETNTHKETTLQSIKKR